MPPQRVSLLSFLSSAQNALSSAIQHSTPITFVVGNESAGESMVHRLGLVSYDLRNGPN